MRRQRASRAIRPVSIGSSSTRPRQVAPTATRSPRSTTPVPALHVTHQVFRSRTPDSRTPARKQTARRATPNPRTTTPARAAPAIRRRWHSRKRPSNTPAVPPRVRIATSARAGTLRQRARRATRPVCRGDSPTPPPSRARHAIRHPPATTAPPAPAATRRRNRGAAQRSATRRFPEANTPIGVSRARSVIRPAVTAPSTAPRATLLMGKTTEG